MLRTGVGAAERRGFLQRQDHPIVVGIDVGSGYDVTARVLQRHWGKTYPRQPDGDRAEPTRRRQPDHGEPARRQRAVRRHGDRRAVQRTADCAAAAAGRRRFDPAKMLWLGSTNRETQVTSLWHTAPVKTFADDPQDRSGHRRQAPGTAQWDYPCSPTPCSTTSSRSSPATRARRTFTSRWSAARCTATARPIGRRCVAQRQLVKEEGQDASRNGRSRGIPTCPTCRWCSTSPNRRRTRRARTAGRAAGIRPAVLRAAGRAGRPREALRRAFDATMKDPEFLADAKKLRLEIDPITGEQAQELIARVSRRRAGRRARAQSDERRRARASE